MPVWVVQTWDLYDKWYQVFVEPHKDTTSPLGVVDFSANVDDVQYRVLPIEKHDPRDGLEILKSPWDLQASPNGWQFFGTPAKMTMTPATLSVDDHFHILSALLT